MNQLVSFVIPTRNSGKTLGNCLSSIRAQQYPTTEVLVVDNDSIDETQYIAERLADKVIRKGPERAAQRNAGAKSALGEFVVFIDSDMILSTEIAGEIVQTFENSQLHALVLPERVMGKGFWDRCRAIEKEAYLGDEAVEAARAFRRTTFLELGGYQESLTGPEDWELPDRLRRQGYEIGRIRSFVLHDERTLGLAEAFNKKRYYGRSFGRFLKIPGTRRGARFARMSLFKPMRRLFTDPLHVLGLYGLKATELLGLLVGMLESRRRQDNVY